MSDEAIDGLLDRLTDEMRRSAALRVDLQEAHVDIWALRRSIRRHRSACQELDADDIIAARDEMWALVEGE
jgi:hypothetical protein